MIPRNLMWKVPLKYVLVKTAKPEFSLFFAIGIAVFEISQIIWLLFLIFGRGQNNSLHYPAIGICTIRNLVQISPKKLGGVGLFFVCFFNFNIGNFASALNDPKLFSVNVTQTVHSHTCHMNRRPKFSPVSFNEEPFSRLECSWLNPMIKVSIKCFYIFNIFSFWILKILLLCLLIYDPVVVKVSKCYSSYQLFSFF